MYVIGYKIPTIIKCARDRSYLGQYVASELNPNFLSFLTQIWWILSTAFNQNIVAIKINFFYELYHLDSKIILVCILVTC